MKKVDKEMVKFKENYLSDIDSIFGVTKRTVDDCELCKLTKRTKWYYEDVDWIICECKTCHRPMVVYKEHTMFIPIMKWVSVLAKVLDLFGSDIKLRFKQRKIRNHFHIHIYGVRRDEKV